MDTNRWQLFRWTWVGALSAGIFYLAACGQGTVTPQNTRSSRALEHPVGGASCDGYCGGPAAGGCWCDDLCETYGDCCSDKQEVCDSPAPCYVTGCNNEVCADSVFNTDCTWKDEYVCYQGATCERQPDGSCGWTPTPELTQCLASCQPPPPPPPGECWDDTDCGPGAHCEGAVACPCGVQCFAPPQTGTCIADEPAPCYVTGCNNEVCADSVFNTDCTWKDTYACYQGATCERQPDGSCGWTPTPELLECLATAADSPCVGHCGGQAPEGCWCDSACAYYGDCCSGKTSVCP